MQTINKSRKQKELRKLEILALRGVQELISEVRRLPHAKAIVASGSRTTGEYSKNSDLDLDVLFDNNHLTRNFGEVANGLVRIINSTKTDVELHLWPKKIIGYVDPAAHLTTDTPLDRFALDGFSGLCKHIFWFNLKSTGIVLCPDGSDLLEKMPACLEIPHYEGFELHTISTRDVLRGIVEEDSHLLAKAILRTASAEQILRRGRHGGKTTSYSDSARYFISVIGKKPARYFEYIPDNHHKHESQRIEELITYAKLVNEALEIKLDKREHFSFENNVILDFFEFVLRRTFKSNYLSKDWRENIIRGTTYAARTSPGIIGLLHRGLAEKKIDLRVVEKYNSDVELVLLSDMHKQMGMNKLNISDFDWSSLRLAAASLSEEYSDRALAGKLESSMELSMMDIKTDTVIKAREILNAMWEGRNPNYVIKMLLGDYDGALASIDRTTPTLENLLIEANLLNIKKDHAGAEKSLNLALKLSTPDSGLFGTANINLLLGNTAKQYSLEESLQYYAAAIDANDKLLPAYLGKADSLFGLGRFDEAFACLDSARRAKLGLPVYGWLLRAACAEKLENAAEHVMSLANLVDLQPSRYNHITTKCNDFAQKYISTGDFERAQFYVAGLISLEKDHPEYNYLFALCLHELGKNKLAQRHILRASQFSLEQKYLDLKDKISAALPKPTIVDSQLLAAMDAVKEAYLPSPFGATDEIKSLKFELANTNIQLTTDNANPELWYKRGDVLTKLGRFRDGLRAYEQAERLKLQPNKTHAKNGATR